MISFGTVSTGFVTLMHNQVATPEQLDAAREFIERKAKELENSAPDGFEDLV